MCIGIPMRIVSLDGPMAIAQRNDGTQERIDLMLLGDVPAGAWVLAFNGSAVRALEDIEAQQIEAALQALQAALRGESSVDDYFADLVGREPQLPPHLRGRP